MEGNPRHIQAPGTVGGTFDSGVHVNNEFCIWGVFYRIYREGGGLHLSEDRERVASLIMCEGGAPLPGWCMPVSFPACIIIVFRDNALAYDIRSCLN